MSHLEAMRGDAEAAREHYRRSRAMLTDLGFTLSAAITSLHSGPAEILAGDLEQAEAELRADYDTLQAMGDTGYTPTVAALLAEVLHDQGRDREAAELAEVCREKASPQDVGAQYQWRSIQARLLAAAGRTAEAEPLARESVRLISTTDQPDVKGQALTGLAEVLEAAGKRSEAAGALRDAVALFEAKGNAVAAARAREELERLTSTLPPIVAGI
jgi:ATP/maltotriose-dependent transcriptional regulator MalT